VHGHRSHGMPSYRPWISGKSPANGSKLAGVVLHDVQNVEMISRSALGKVLDGFQHQTGLIVQERAFISFHFGCNLLS